MLYGRRPVQNYVRGEKEQMKQILETSRLMLRELVADDFGDVCDILQDEACMYAYEHAFSKEESLEWLQRQQARYRQYGTGLWAVIRKEDGIFLGQCGITLQHVAGPEEHTPCRRGEGTAKMPLLSAPASEPLLLPGPEEEVEIGYLLKRRFWHRGYATEAACGCRDYAFQVLGIPRVTSIIREDNLASRLVAERVGMWPDYRFIKRYYGIDMPHIVYALERQ